MEKINVPAQTAIIVFAKTLNVPSKTRIAFTEGQQTAQRIYRELLAATSKSLVNLSYHVAFTGSNHPGELSEYFGNAISFFKQEGSGLGERMKQTCLKCQEIGYSTYIVIGCDCPERNADEIVYAAKCLTEGADVVLGPVEDGGYHLAGVNNRGLVIFDATQWSTPNLLSETQDIIRNNKLTFTMLPVRFDIDTIDDYRRWKVKLD